jgi:hypothetical protein
MFTVPSKLVAVVLVLAGVTAAGAQTRPVPLTDVSRLPPWAAERYRAVQPRADEVRWQQIPWQTDLKEALRLAREEKRPALVWVSDDEPLDRC